MTDAGGPDDYGFVADLYDHVVPYRDRQDVAFFVEAATRAGNPVLEIGCGSGRVLVPIAPAGVVFGGVGASPAAPACSRGRLGDEPADVRARARLVEADMRSFDLGRTFTLAALPFRPFQHLLTVDDQLACLRTVRGHLGDGGVVI